MSTVDVDGLKLNVERAGSGPPVVLLHGFTGSAAGWASLIESLSPQFTTLAFDILGHGLSDAPHEPDRYQIRRCVDDLAAALRALGYERACWLGYSMGGRTALQIAVHRPEVVSALILEGATPGLRSEAERSERRASDEALAGRIERDGIADFVDHWEGLPLFATQTKLPRATRDTIRAGRLANRPQGLANSLRGMGTGAQEPLHDRLGAVSVPVLLTAGALDERFSVIAGEMARTLPNGTMAPIEGAGHAAHLEAPAAFAETVLTFLRRVYAAETAVADRR